MNKDKLVVSVIMSVYNGERYLKESIESILNQTFTHFEFIIVNDASIDKTREIIQSYTDSRIVYIENEINIGQTKSLNKAIRIARGKYIARMDADDIAFPNRFSVQVEFLNKNTSINVIGSWYLIVDDTGKIVRKVCLPTNSTEIKALLIASSPLTYPYIAHPTVMLRREIFGDIGYYNEKYYIAQDYDLWIRISRKYRIVNLSQVLLKYRIHKQSLTNDSFQMSIKEAENIINFNITYYMPEINVTERRILFNMLLFHKQNNKKEGEKVFDVFHFFYLQVMSGELKNTDKIAIEYCKRFKLFYLPQLFSTNMISSLKMLVYNFFVHPHLIMNKRFFVSIYRSIKLKMNK